MCGRVCYSLVFTLILPAVISAESYEEIYWREIGFNLQLLLTAMAILACVICVLSSLLFAFCYWHAKQRDFTITPTLSFLNLNLMPVPPSGHMQAVVSSFVNKRQPTPPPVDEQKRQLSSGGGDNSSKSSLVDEEHCEGKGLTVTLRMHDAIEHNNNNKNNVNNGGDNNNNNNINNNRNSTNIDIDKDDEDNNNNNDNNNDNNNNNNNGEDYLWCVRSIEKAMAVHRAAELLSEYDSLCDYVERPNIFATMESLSSVVTNNNK